VISFSTEGFVTTLALIGIVLLTAGLMSGFIERTGLPQVAVFLILGAALGPAGLNVLHIGLDSPILRVVATLSLALVLFTDAVTIDLVDVRRYSRVAFLMIGPGTLLTAAVLGLLAWWMLGLQPAAAAILGAALASTDPVLLRGLLRERGISAQVKQALKLESGFNDAVLLPIVLIAMAFLGQGGMKNATDWARLGIDLFILGPGAGVLVALVAVAVLDVIRRRVGMRRDYESLYSLGVAFTAYSVAESVHGSGFLAAFAAGLTISTLDVELCDCFLEYGETTAEMALLFTFVLFGSSLIWDGFLVLSGLTVLFALLVLFSRVPILLLALSRTTLDWKSRRIIAWFGPRGLSSLLEVLLPVFAGLSGSTRLFEITSLVVLFSVVLHGGTTVLLARRRQPPAAAPPVEGAALIERTLPQASPTSPETLPAAASEPIATGTRPLHEVPVSDGQVRGDGQPDRSATPKRLVQITPLVADSARITIDEIRHLQDMGTEVVIVDARTDRTANRSDLQARGALRMDKDHAREQAAALGLPKTAWIAVYCA
jgi:NhaP-type Na+/H+ or K+/H+ antiporter